MKSGRLIAIVFVVSYALLLPAGCRQPAKVAEEPIPDAAPVAAEEPVEVTKPDKPVPKIVFESLEYDFGTVGPRQKLLGEFKFTNRGDAPLKITKVDKCCGAVTRLETTDYAPGESGVLKVEYRSASTASTMKKRLYVNSNDKSSPRTTLTITAKIELRVSVEPRSLTLLLKDENAACPNITIRSTKNELFSITSFKCTGDYIKADFDNSVRATEFIIEPKADMSKLKKDRSGRISIGVAYSDPDAAPETATIIFHAKSRFSIRPSMLIALYGESREPVKKSLWITNNYGEDIQVESTSSKEGHVKVLSQRKIGGSYQFQLEITPPPDADVKRFNDIFTINIKENEPLQINCRGIYTTRTKKRAGK
ncbi:MAG: DUF1573 domain-containing protein [Planctomycetota bacterium]|jgi:hypothetical protein